MCFQYLVPDLATVFSSIEKPYGLINISSKSKATHVRPIAPVLWGISGATNTIFMRASVAGIENYKIRVFQIHVATINLTIPFLSLFLPKVEPQLQDWSLQHRLPFATLELRLKRAASISRHPFQLHLAKEANLLASV
jgi:hypothetical protein